MGGGGGDMIGQECRHIIIMGNKCSWPMGNEPIYYQHVHGDVMIQNKNGKLLKNRVIMLITLEGLTHMMKGL